ncbi:hypothetical protein ERJ75_001747800 [Trypanosoma vivax]|uniref:Uncharacterized protein n=1 Tax=Trypanosoma vivax (strain Y486) TaxID=1055687 RepID=G0U2M7_TRYVY|nr:hypothetical protein TRVL_02193 [Trypanosoma vivax]KAH8604194.1 hypothetical protein ERJ75_001747800 [Trypanosoma vivax]CCC50530.1 conserved hypothetical protein [Trypanosoma vivax Y486]
MQGSSLSNGREGPLQQQMRTERIVRLEVQRRHAKGTLRVFDNMIREVDDQLLYVSHFKKEWLQHRRQLEDVRQEIVKSETTARKQLLEEETSAVRSLMDHAKSLKALQV